MSTALEKIRKEAGYSAARDLAAKAGIPPTTFRRYETDPGKMPLQAAAAVADAVGCSIDALYGRENRAAGTSAYEHLVGEYRRQADAYLAYLLKRQEDSDQRKAIAQRTREDELCRRYERAFEAELDAAGKLDDHYAFASPAQRRQRFEAYLRRRAGEAGADADATDQSVNRLLAAYDRSWEVMSFDDGSQIDYQVEGA